MNDIGFPSCAARRQRRPVRTNTMRPPTAVSTLTVSRMINHCPLPVIGIACFMGMRWLVRVMVSMFGRDTPVELELAQAEPV